MLALWQEHDVTDPDQRSLPSALRTCLLRMSYVWFAGGDNNPIDDIHGVGSVKTKASNGVTNAQILE
ncbi:hypothetical protein YC2023_019217 [Brassica napus]